MNARIASMTRVWMTVALLAGWPAVAGAADGSIVGWGRQAVGSDLSGGFVAVAGGRAHSLGLKADGSIVAWGHNYSGQCDVPAPNTDFVAVAGGRDYSLGLKADGSIVAWGDNVDGQCDVPEPNTDFVAVAARRHNLGLKADGSIVAWGNNAYGQCDVPEPNTDFVAITAGGGYYGSHSLGLKADGSIVAWGHNGYGQCDVPPPNTNFVAVAAGYYYSLGLKSDGSIVAWGRNDDGQCNVPSPNTDFVAVASGYEHSLGLKADGSIVSWGRNNYGQCNVPAPNTYFVAVAGGQRHSLGLKANGSIVVWGSNGASQCNVPEPNTDFVAVAASWHSLGLKADGSIVAWGNNTYGQCNVPAPNEDFVAIAAGERHSLGLKAGGSIAAWGWNNCGQCNVPSPNTDFVAVAAGYWHSLGLKADGSIVAWEYNYYGQCDVPAPNTDFVALAGGEYHSLGLKADGSIVAWGANWEGQCNVPAPNTDFVAVAAGGEHSLGLKSDGSIVAWGWNQYDQCDVPAPNTDFVAVAGGDCYSLGLKGDGSIVAWGWNQYDQCDVPEPNTDFVAVAGGFGHSLGLKGEPGPGNEPPVADAGGPYFGTVDQPVTFDASDSQDPDGTIVGYRWDWTDDGEWDTDWLPEPITTYAYDAEFVGQLKLEVEDDGGDRDTGSALVWVGGGGDAPPVADAGGPYGALQFVPMMFDGTRSYDPDGQVVRYDWKFHTADSWCNDVGPTPQFMYMATGPQFVTLRVHDDHGAIDTASTCVTVYDDPSALPLAFIDSITPHPAVYGEPVQFQGHGRTIEGGFTMSAYEWSSDVDGIIGTSAEFTTSTLSLGRHEVSFRVQAPNGIWSQSATDVLLISEDENYGTTIVTPPYRWAHADYGGLGLLAAAYQQSNLSNGSFNTIASAGVIGGVYSWAWQGLSLAVRNPKEITIDGEIIHVSGNPQYGISCVAGNAKLGWIDYNHNSQVDDGEWFADYIDPPLSFETALAKIISAACMIVGAAAGPDLPGIGAAAPWISLLATFVSGPQVVYDVYEADPEHDFKNVRFTFDADGGEITHVAVGIKSEASACILGTGVAAIGGQLSKVKITGMYPPDQPDVTGPEPPVGYVDVPYEFTATATDVTPTDDVSYEFDWGDSSGSGWTEFVPSGTGVTRSHAFSEPGEYDVIARAWDGDSILVLAEQIDMISEDSALYTMLIVERGDVVFTALCPMDLVITDPEGRLVAKTWSSVPGVEYVEKDLNRDGELDDRVLIRDALSGTYKVRVLPEADADRSETFSLFASSGGKSFVLARDVRISDIPEGGYRFVMGGKPDVEDAAVDSGTVQPISGR